MKYILVCVSSVEVQSSLLEMETIYDPSVTHIVLDKLDPSTYYNLKVIARTAKGDGPPITLRGATLLDGGKFTVYSKVFLACQ